MKTVLLATAIIFCLPTSQVMSGTIPGSVSTTLVEPEVDFASLDEITLITGEVIDGVILKRLANFVVYIDDRGVERMEPAGIIKHIRKAGSLETISLAEALGEAKEDRGVAGSGGAAERPRRGGPEERPAKRPVAVILSLDHDKTTFDDDARATYQSAFDQLEGHSPTTVIVSVNEVDLPLEAVSWVSDRLERLDPDVEVRVLLGRTSVISLLLYTHADKAHWLEGGMVSASRLDPATITRISRVAPAGLTSSAIEALGSDGTVKLDSQGRLVASKSGNAADGIDANTARTIGLCHGRVSGARKSDAEALLGTDENWRFQEIRIRSIAVRMERDRLKASKQVAAAQKALADINSAVASIRSTARIFDKFYRDYDPDRPGIQRVKDIWLKTRSWEDRRIRQRSTKLQGDVRSAIQSLKNAQNRLDTIVNMLPEETPEKIALKACADNAKAAIRSLHSYESGIQRNAVDKYETGRGTAMELGIGGC